MKTVIIVFLTDLVFFLIAGIIIYRKSRPVLRDKYDLKTMYEKATGKKYETKKYLKWLSGFLLVVLSFSVSAQSGKIPLRQIADIDTTSIVKNSWQTYIERLQPNINTYWYSDPNGIRYDGYVGINKPSSNYYRLDINGQIYASAVRSSGRVSANGVWLDNNTITLEGQLAGPGSPSYDTEGKIWMNYTDQKLYFTNYTDTYDLTAAGSGGTYTGWNLLTNGTFRKSIASGNNVNFAAGTGMTLSYTSANNTITFSSSGSGGESLWAEDANGINYIGNVGIGASSSSTNGLTLSRNSLWAADIANTRTSTGHGVHIKTANNSNSYANLFLESSAGSLFSVTNAGRVIFNKYGVGTFNGTATKLLGVDAAGYVVETTGSSSYILPIATSSVLGGVKLGYASTANNFALQLSSERAYTTIPNATTSTKGIASFNSSKFITFDGLVNLRLGAIKAEDLSFSNSAISGYVPTYNSTTGGFTWAPMTSGGGSLWTDGGSYIYPSPSKDVSVRKTAPKLSFYDTGESTDSHFINSANTFSLYYKGLPVWTYYSTGSGLLNIKYKTKVDGDIVATGIATTSGYATASQDIVSTLNYTLGAKATRTVSTNTSITITNLPDGAEGQIEVINSGSYSLSVYGSTGYTTTKKMGANANLKPNDNTTVVYWRSGSTLFYGFIHQN